jgi:hypothetical protein
VGFQKAGFQIFIPFYLLPFQFCLRHFSEELKLQIISTLIGRFGAMLRIRQKKCSHCRILIESNLVQVKSPSRRKFPEAFRWI